MTAASSQLPANLLIPEIVPGQLGVGRDISWEIVGLVSNEKVSLSDPLSSGVYVPIHQSVPLYVNIVVRTDTPAAPLQPSIRRVIHDLNKDQAIFQMLTVDQAKSATMTANRQQTFLLVAFTSVAMLLGTIGIYAVISFLVAQRTAEIGIRMALGSTPSQIIALVLARVMSWTGIGAAVGLMGSLAAAHALRNLLFGVSEHDPRTFVLGIVALVSASVLAAWVPSRRAARIDPMMALRAD